MHRTLSFDLLFLSLYRLKLSDLFQKNIIYSLDRCIEIIPLFLSGISLH